jgi:hypothetical protein
MKIRERRTQRTQGPHRFLSAFLPTRARGQKSLIPYPGSPTCARCLKNQAWLSTAPVPFTGTNS